MDQSNPLRSTTLRPAPARGHRISTDDVRIDEIRIDAPQATCPAFVGPDLDMLAITSAQENLEHWTDNSGALFLDPAPGATGLPVTPWPGSTTHPYWKGTA